jgi:tetratricopeptide (TPR) repeat protein
MSLRKSIVLLLVLFGFCLVLVVEELRADLKEEQTKIDAMKKPYEVKIKRWELTANTFLVLSIVIGILGTLTGALHASNTKLPKGFILAMGIAITVMTGVNNTALKGDYRNLVSQARKIMMSIDIELVRGYGEGNEQARTAWLDKMRSLFLQLEDIEKPQTSSPIQQANKGEGLGTSLYAQARETQAPIWLTSLPSDSANIYFVGMGENSDLEKAKALSSLEAKCEASIMFFLQVERATAGIARAFKSFDFAMSMLESAEVADTYFQFSERTQRFRFYTLLMLSKKRMAMDKKFYSIEKGTFMPSSLSAFPENLQGLSQADFQRSLKRQDLLMGSIYDGLSSEEAAIFWDVHEARLHGDFQHAIARIGRIVETKTMFYFGWFEVALAYEDHGDTTQADQAYRRALALEPGLPFRDTRLILSYTNFLQKQKRNPEALDLVSKAIQGDPNNDLLQIKLASLKK